MIMPPLSKELHDSILGYWDKASGLLYPPTMTHKSRERYTIYEGNFFFKEPKSIPTTLTEISALIENTIKEHISSNGELIKSSIREGEIWDCGKRYFEVRGGFHFEVYCFTCKSYTFVRVSHERTLYPPEKEWLSIDIDEDLETIWLEQP
jgi:hypothetical protein